MSVPQQVERRPVYTHISSEHTDPDGYTYARRSSLAERVTYPDGRSEIQCVHCGKVLDHHKQITGHYVGKHHAEHGTPRKPQAERVPAAWVEEVRHFTKRSSAAALKNGHAAQTLEQVRLLLQLDDDSEPLRQRIAELERELSKVRGVMKALADLSRDA